MSASGTNDLGAYVAAEVDRAERDYENVRSRALNLVATSGGLVTLVSGLLAIAVGTDKSIIPTESRWTVALALGCFVISTVSALMINYPQRVTSSDQTKLGALVEDHWNDDGWSQRVAEILVEYLKSLRQDNGRTAGWLTASISFQIAGISVIAISAFLILLHAG